MTKILIFTDLDGSLLNHGDYSFEDARPSLARIRQAKIPLIMTTSKTRSEVEALQAEMGLREPFIVENGGGVFFPAGYRDFTIAESRPESGYRLVRLGIPYDRIRRSFLQIRTRLQIGIKGFGDMSAEDIAAETGLAPDRVEMARVREFTEPFLLTSGADLVAVKEMAATLGLKVTSGGRFHHLIGARQDKGEAVRRVRDIFQRNAGSDWLAVGIGDSENDLPLLKEVDIPVLIPNPGRGDLNIRQIGLLRAGEPGSRGWNSMIENILNEWMPGDASSSI
jgi:mannosyl-3-phosphoglycerate phosphatase